MTHPNQQPAIRNLQRYLRTLAYFDERIGEVPIDGVFDTATEEAVLAFQRRFDLVANGVVASTTWNEIISLYEALYQGNRLQDGQYPGFDVGA